MEQRLGLVLRGVQRMADGLGTIESRLPELASGEALKALSDRVDEYRVRARTEVNQVGDVVTALANAVDAVMREQQALSEVVRRDPPATDSAAVDRLTEAVRGLRDDLAESHRILQEETKAAVERVAGEQAERAVRLHEAIGEAGHRTAEAVVRAVADGADAGVTTADLQRLRTTLDGRHVVVTEAIAAVREQVAAAVDELGSVLAAPPSEGPPGPPRDDTLVRASLAEVRADLRRLQGDVVSSMGQLRTDAGAHQAELRDEVVQAVVARVQHLQAGGGVDVDTVLDRISVLESRLPQPTSIEPVLARLEALEARLAEPPDVSGLDARLAALEARIVPTDLSGVDAKLSALEERLERPDLADVEARLAAFVERLASPDLSGVEAKLAALEASVGSPADLGGVYDRLGGIEWRMGERLDPLDGRLASLEQRLDALRTNVPDSRIADRLASIESGLEQVAQREDLRRGVDRMLGAVSSAEQAVAGEVRAVDARIGAIAEEVRVVRVLRDGLDALADGIDGIRQLASRTATSQQMTEVTAELAAVLREIDSARSQVLEVEQSAGPVRAEVVAVGTEVDDLGKRIDHLAELVEQQSAPGDVSQRLRQLSVTARQLGNGVLEDLRSRRKR
jgi:chromosome segregation ATPase